MKILNYLNELEYYFPLNSEFTNQIQLVGKRELKESQKRKISKRVLPQGHFEELPLAASRKAIFPFLSNTREGTIVNGILQKLIELKLMSEHDLPQYMEDLQKKISKGTCAGETFACDVANVSQILYGEELDKDQQRRLAMLVHLFRHIKKDLHKKTFEQTVEVISLKKQIKKKRELLHKNPSAENLHFALQNLTLKEANEAQENRLIKKINKKSKKKDELDDYLDSVQKVNDRLSNFTTVTYEKAELKMIKSDLMQIKKEQEEVDIAKIIEEIRNQTNDSRNYSVLLSLSYNGKSRSTHRIRIQINPLELYDLKIGRISYSSKEDLYKDLESYFKHYKVTGVSLKTMRKAISIRE